MPGFQNDFTQFVLLLWRSSVLNAHALMIFFHGGSFKLSLTLCFNESDE